MKFLKWWLLICLLGVGAVIAYRFNVFGIIFAGDITYLSWGIMAMFAWCSIRVGWDMWHQQCSNCEIYYEWAAWFSILGILGTVLGFYHTFAIFQTVEAVPENISKLTTQMAAGIGTAIITTATGLICRFLLEFQLKILNEA